MLTDSGQTHLLTEEKPSVGLRFAAVASAILITALLLSGYAYLRKRHALQASATRNPIQKSAPLPKGPPKAHVQVNDAMLQGGKTLIGGTVKNISSQKLSGLLIELELRRRKDGSIEKRTLSIEPPQLDPQQEGRYAIKLDTGDFSTVRLAGLKSNEEIALVYSSSPGQKRPPERLEPKVIIVAKPSSRRDQFLNSPDNPARVP
jgi:hypothetical protein